MLWQTFLDKNFVVFSVKACEDVRILLTDVPGIGTANAIEVVIETRDSAKDKNTIRNWLTQEDIRYRFVSDLLSCNSFRTFWISWTESFIAFGTGAKVGQQQILATDGVSDFSVTGVSFAAKDTQDSIFEFGENEGL